MGKRSPRNNSSLADPITCRVSTVAFSAISSSRIDAVPTCKRKDWGMVNKTRFNPASGEGFTVVGDIGSYSGIFQGFVEQNTKLNKSKLCNCTKLFLLLQGKKVTKMLKNTCCDNSIFLVYKSMLYPRTLCNCKVNEQ